MDYNLLSKMHLPRRSSSCLSCKKKFNSGDSYLSQIKGENRYDYCPDCWDGSGEFWQGKIPLKKERLPDEKALQLFRSKKSFRPLLALYLESRKELVLRAQLSTKAMKCYELLATGELFEVPMAPIRQEELEEIDAELSC